MNKSVDILGKADAQLFNSRACAIIRYVAILASLSALVGCAQKYMDIQSAIVQAVADAQEARVKLEDVSVDNNTFRIDVSVTYGIDASGEIPIPVVPIGVNTSRSTTTNIGFDITMEGYDMIQDLKEKLKPTIYTMGRRTSRLTPAQ